MIEFPTFSGDLAYDGVGYGLVLLNDFFTAAYSIYVKKVNDKKVLFLAILFNFIGYSSL